jgi:hypothetical protein
VLVSVGVITLQLHAHTDAGGATPPPTPASVPAGTSGPLAAVEAAVRASTQIRSVPADLSPSLAQASTNWGGPVGACWPALGVSTVPGCVYGDPHGTRTAVLYGDSHAAMWADVISRIAGVANWKLIVLTKGDCPADLLPYVNPPGFGNPAAPYTACEKWHQFATRRIRQLHPDLVIISQEIRGASNTRSYTPAQWGQGLHDAMKQLDVPTSRIVVLGNIPVLPESGPQCLSRNTDDVQKCSGPVSYIDRQYIDAERSAATGVDARYIDVTPWFCSSTCTAIVDHYEVYFDRYHITSDYSFFLADVLAQALGTKSAS